MKVAEGAERREDDAGDARQLLATATEAGRSTSSPIR
jgi:hypothetical protein